MYIRIICLIISKITRTRPPKTSPHRVSNQELKSNNYAEQPSISSSVVFQSFSWILKLYPRWGSRSPFSSWLPSWPRGPTPSSSTPSGTSSGPAAGAAAVSAFLAEADLRMTEPKAPKVPPKTNSFQRIADATREKERENCASLWVNFVQTVSNFLDYIISF